jgi:hypothetical protein
VNMGRAFINGCAAVFCVGVVVFLERMWTACFKVGQPADPTCRFALGGVLV